MEVVAVPAEELEASRDGAARAAEDSGGLAVGDFGDEETEELEMEARLLQAVVEPKGLDGEGPEASATAEALDGAAVALSAEAAVESEAEVFP